MPTFEAKCPIAQCGIVSCLEVKCPIAQCGIISCLVGILYTTKQLDREEKSSYVLTVKAAAEGTEDIMSSTTEVAVIVTDTNDHHPIISENFEVSKITKIYFI